MSLPFHDSILSRVGASGKPGAIHVVILAGLVQALRWHARHGLPRWVALTALFSVSQDFWRDTDARKLLTS